MTVKELKEKLNEFDENLIVFMPDTWSVENVVPYTSAVRVAQGVNESSHCLFICGDWNE